VAHLRIERLQFAADPPSAGLGPYGRSDTVEIPAPQFLVDGRATVVERRSATRGNRSVGRDGCGSVQNSSTRRPADARRSSAWRLPSTGIGNANGDVPAGSWSNGGGTCSPSRSSRTAQCAPRHLCIREARQEQLDAAPRSALQVAEITIAGGGRGDPDPPRARQALADGRALRQPRALPPSERLDAEPRVERQLLRGPVTGAHSSEIRIILCREKMASSPCLPHVARGEPRLCCVLEQQQAVFVAPSSPPLAVCGNPR
jgi:hypothetical protein